MSEEVAKYEYEVGFPRKYSTQYKWILNDWSLLYDFVDEFTSPIFELNGTAGTSRCTCKVTLSPRTLEKVLTVQFSDTRAIEAMKVIISTGDIFCQNNDRKPISKILNLKMETARADVPKRTFVTDRNDVLVFLVKITIMRVSDCNGLLNPTELIPQRLNISNRPRNILENFKIMFNRKAFCDVTFIVGDKTFHAHKAVIAAQSKTLESIFVSMNEQNNNTIEISHCDANVFEQFLNYLYGGEAIQLEEIVEKMIEIAYSYNVSELKITCENIMLKTLSENSAIRYVILADKINCDTLKNAAIRMIRNSTAIIEKALLEADPATMANLKEILSENQLEEGTVPMIASIFH